MQLGVSSGEGESCVPSCLYLDEIVRKLGLVVFCAGKPNLPMRAVYTSDLLSDVLANAPRGCILVTVQAHLNTVAVAYSKEIPAILVCNGRPVPDDMKAACEKKGIALFGSRLCQYELSGRLFCMLSAKKTL